MPGQDNRAQKHIPDPRLCFIETQAAEVEGVPLPNNDRFHAVIRTQKLFVGNPDKPVGQGRYGTGIVSRQLVSARALNTVDIVVNEIAAVIGTCRWC